MEPEYSTYGSTTNTVTLSVNNLRKVVRFYIDSNLNESALFWADKVVTISKDYPSDVYWLAQSMFRCGEYNRAVNLIKNKGFHDTQPLFKWLTGLCLFEAKQYEDALLVLTDDHRLNNLSTEPSTNSVRYPSIGDEHILEGFTPEGLQSALLVLKGRIYEKLDKRNFASECFKKALKLDIFCYEAFQCLVQHQMLTVMEEKELISSLSLKSQLSNCNLLPSVYEMLLNKYHELPPTVKCPPGMAENLDLIQAQAERLFYCCSFKSCYKLTNEILKIDPFHKQTLRIHISSLVELKKPNALFYLAHNLVDMFPEWAISWYAVGCYYLLTANQGKARRYLSKAICLDKYFGPAWVAYGHSFAGENEHDQAMAAYFSAAKVMRGCHLPLLYVGAECGLINNTKLAERFLSQAQMAAPKDPFIFHEMGTIAFQNEEYNKAEEYFLKSLDEVQKNSKQVIAEKWEPLLNNLGHTFRKQRRYSEALTYHHLALSVLPQNPTTLTNIGFIQALQEKFSDAVETFHKVLSLKEDDSFSITMLSYLIEQIVYVTPTLQEFEE